MSDQGEQDDKTEAPTEKRLQQARDSGDVATSREAPLFAGLLATLMVCSLFVRDGAMRMAEVLARLLDDPGHWTLNNGADAALLSGVLAQAVTKFLLPIMVVFVVAGLAMSFAQGMPSFVLSRIQPKLSKLSPAKGLGRIFSRHGAVEFAKNCGKLALVGLVLAILLKSEQQSVTDAMFLEPAAVPDLMLKVMVRLLSGTATVFALVAGFDMVWSRLAWNKKMRMSRREIKEEHRQSEGDPIFKAKRRSVALDRARRRMLGDVTRATVVIANPTHYAIALRYVRSEGGAPIVIAKGQDLIALKIREIAESNSIEVVENKPLARSMYDLVEVAKPIPPQFYKAVAEVIHFIQSRKAPKPLSRAM